MVCSTKIKTLPEYKSGSTWTFPFQWNQRSGAPLDLTGCVARMQVRHATTKRLLAEPDDITIDTTGGLVTATFSGETTAEVPPGTHLTDLKLVFASGESLSTETLSLPVVEGQTA